MGYLSARGMALSPVDRRVAVHWHLRNNMFPPLPEEYLDAAITALELAEEAGPFEEGFMDEEVLDTPVVLPDDLHIYPRGAWQDDSGRRYATARHLIQVMRLDAFIDFGEELDEEND